MWSYFIRFWQHKPINSPNSNKRLVFAVVIVSSSRGSNQILTRHLESILSPVEFHVGFIVDCMLLIRFFSEHSSFPLAVAFHQWCMTMFILMFFPVGATGEDWKLLKKTVLFWILVNFGQKNMFKVLEFRNFEFYVWVSVHHKSILYKESTRCNFGSIVY